MQQTVLPGVLGPQNEDDPYSLSFNVRIIDNLSRSLPNEITLGINKRGVDFYRSVPKECLHSVELKDIRTYGYYATAVYLEMKDAGFWNTLKFKTKQGEEICYAIEKRINDVVASRAAATSGSVNGDISNVDASEKRAHDLSKALEESQKTVNLLQEEMETLKQRLKMQATQLAEYQKLNQEELVSRKRYHNIIEDETDPRKPHLAESQSEDHMMETS